LNRLSFEAIIYKLREMEGLKIDVLKVKHLEWVANVRLYIDDKIDLDRNYLSSHVDSELGKFYYPDIKEKFGQFKELQVMESRLKKMHINGDFIWEYKKSNNIEMMEIHFTDIVTISDKMTILFEKIQNFVVETDFESVL
jgi:hypothetical protein